MKDRGTSGGSAALRIFLAEDHEMVREGLKALVNSQPDMEVVGEAGDGHAAVAGAIDLRPDVVVMDISMPKMNGLEATEKLKEACPQVKVLTLTRHTDIGYMQKLFGAFKDGTGIDLCRMIRAIDGEIPIFFYTAVAYESELKKALKAGAQGCFVKPVDVNDLMRTVSRYSSSKYAEQNGGGRREQ